MLCASVGPALGSGHAAVLVGEVETRRDETARGGGGLRGGGLSGHHTPPLVCLFLASSTTTTTTAAGQTDGRQRRVGGCAPPRPFPSRPKSTAGGAAGFARGRRAGMRDAGMWIRNSDWIRLGLDDG
jgi:hypothetical protein